MPEDIACMVPTAALTAYSALHSAAPALEVAYNSHKLFYISAIGLVISILIFEKIISHIILSSKIFWKYDLATINYIRECITLGLCVNFVYQYNRHFWKRLP